MFSEKFFSRQIDKAFENAQIISTDIHSRIVIFSDCHRGNGTWGDSFLPNKTIFEAALTYYFNGGFTYIELGDGDELWENRCFEPIAEVHGDIFEILAKFRASGRLFMIWGNHDRIKELRSFSHPKLPHACQSLIIRCPASDTSYHLIHGHQADPLNNQGWKAARWMVRYLWRPLEISGFRDPTSAARNYEKGKLVEQRLTAWARASSINLIAGHTHRPVLHAAHDGWSYSNSGSCVHPGSITCIEIDHGTISLVKWATCADDNQYIHVCRYIIGGPFNM